MPLAATSCGRAHQPQLSPRSPRAASRPDLPGIRSTSPAAKCWRNSCCARRPAYRRGQTGWRMSCRTLIERQYRKPRRPDPVTVFSRLEVLRSLAAPHNQAAAALGIGNPSTVTASPRPLSATCLCRCLPHRRPRRASLAWLQRLPHARWLVSTSARARLTDSRIVTIPSPAAPADKGIPCDMLVR